MGAIYQRKRKFQVMNIRENIKSVLNYVVIQASKGDIFPACREKNDFLALLS